MRTRGVGVVEVDEWKTYALKKAKKYAEKGRWGRISAKNENPCNSRSTRKTKNQRRTKRITVHMHRDPRNTNPAFRTKNKAHETMRSAKM